MAIDKNVKNNIIESLDKILNFNNKDWNNLDINIKTKLIHHYCSIILKKSKVNCVSMSSFSSNTTNEFDQISIPLKSIKPKKLIQYAGFSKNYNKNLYNSFNQIILDYTFEYRNTFFNKNKNMNYYTFSSLPKDKYDNLINQYNKLVYDFLINNIDMISHTQLYEKLIGNNTDKLIILNKSKKVNFDIKDNIIIIKFDNSIKIICELCLTNDKITNNIPIKYFLKLVNYF
jgi:hypothetical protein